MFGQMFVCLGKCLYVWANVCMFGQMFVCLGKCLYACERFCVFFLSFLCVVFFVVYAFVNLA